MCIRDRGKAVVTDTGMRTEMGKIAAVLVNADENVTPLKIKLAQLGKTLGMLALCICFIIFVVGLIQMCIRDSHNTGRPPPPGCWGCSRLPSDPWWRR